jgi:hypothetical protein
LKPSNRNRSSSSAPFLGPSTQAPQRRQAKTRRQTLNFEYPTLPLMIIAFARPEGPSPKRSRTGVSQLMTMKCKIHRLITYNRHNLPHQRREGTSWEASLTLSTASGRRRRKLRIKNDSVMIYLKIVQVCNIIKPARLSGSWCRILITFLGVSLGALPLSLQQCDFQIS